MNHRSIRLAALAVFAALPLASCSSCKKGSGAADAAPETGTGMMMVEDAAPAMTASASAEPADSAMPDTTTAGTKPAAGGPWQGTYKCLNHWTVTQNGNSVVGHT